MSKDEIHRLVGRVLGAMSLALIRPQRNRDVIRGWIGDLRAAADALEARLGGAA